MAVFAMLQLGASPLFAAPLTLEEALGTAEARSRSLPAQEASAEAARQLAVAARQRPDPVLTAGINNVPVTGSNRFSLTRDFMTRRSVGVVQELTRASKLDARGERFERQAEVAEATRQIALALLRRDTAIAWLDLQFLRREVKMLLTQRDEAGLQVEAADAAYRGGRGSQADAFAARTAVEQIEMRIVQSRRDVATARLQLERWIGSLGGDEAAPVPPLDSVPVHEATVAAEISRHPQLEWLRRRQAAAQAEAEVARSERDPDVSVALMYGQREPSFSNMISINFSLPIQWNRENRQDRVLAARLAVVEQLRDEREEATRTLSLEALTLLQAWRSDRERLRRYDNVLLPLVAERTQAALAAYRGARAPLAEVLQAREAEIGTGLERLRLGIAVARSWAQLTFLLPQEYAGSRP